MRFFYIIFLFFILLGCNSKGTIHGSAVDDARVQFAIQKIENAIIKNEIHSGINLLFLQDTTLDEQAYIISKERKNQIQIKGGDYTGMMYGGLELAEMMELNGNLPKLIEPVNGIPYIKKRGLKFNIPLDIRTPSYQDAGDAAQNNIAEMWNFDFWRAYLDRMAENRYNVLTLWNPHPFPSMVKLENYPDVALDNVCGTTFPIDTDRPTEAEAQFIAGCGVSQQVLNHLIVLKEMNIDEKIEFWRKVMAYAKNRGVEVHFITWNIWMNGVAPSGWYRRQENLKGEDGKYGINNDQDNPRTIKYLRECVRQFILTYPDLAGLGVTAGENMENRSDDYDREKWLWRAYGEGVLDAKKKQPDRKIEFIHRFWQSGVKSMMDDFIDLYPDKINLSFKYARARMYASTAPRWADEYIKECRQFGIKSWWNIRNDDIFNFRWGDPEYAAEFIKNIPPADVTAGYFMGSDGYVWGREFTSKHPQHPRQLEVDKHWYNFMLWGRMGYNPNLSKERILGLLALHYSDVDANKLYEAWRLASQIPSMVTRFHWNDWDFQWSVEGCLDMWNGFHNVERFIENKTMEGANFLTIPEYVETILTNDDLKGTTPLEVVDQIQNLSSAVLTFVHAELEKENDLENTYLELVYDLKAWAYMGKYYAAKIKGAFYLHAFRNHVEGVDKSMIIAEMEQALEMWKTYAAAANRNYYPQFMAKTRTIDWMAISKEVEKDIEIVKNKLR